MTQTTCEIHALHMEALCKLLMHSGDMTPTAAHFITRATREHATERPISPSGTALPSDPPNGTHP